MYTIIGRWRPTTWGGEIAATRYPLRAQSLEEAVEELLITVTPFEDFQQLREVSLVDDNDVVWMMILLPRFHAEGVYTVEAQYRALTLNPSTHMTTFSDALMWLSASVIDNLRHVTLYDANEQACLYLREIGA